MVAKMKIWSASCKAAKRKIIRSTSVSPSTRAKARKAATVGPPPSTYTDVSTSKSKGEYGPRKKDSEKYSKLELPDKQKYQITCWEMDYYREKANKLDFDNGQQEQKLHELKDRLDAALEERARAIHRAAAYKVECKGLKYEIAELKAKLEAVEKRWAEYQGRTLIME
jgi:hypothetical protein